MNALTLFVLTAATWRLASLFANEPGPFKVFEHIREYCKSLDRKSKAFHKTYVYQGLLCEWCNSVWFGTLLSVGYHLIDPLPLQVLVPLPLALSAGAVVIKYVVQTLTALKEYLETIKVGAEEVHEWSRKEKERIEKEFAKWPGSPDEEIINTRLGTLANFANAEELS